MPIGPISSSCLRGLHIRVKSTLSSSSILSKTLPYICSQLGPAPFKAIPLSLSFSLFYSIPLSLSIYLSIYLSTV